MSLVLLALQFPGSNKKNAFKTVPKISQVKYLVTKNKTRPN